MTEWTDDAWLQVQTCEFGGMMEVVQGPERPWVGFTGWKQRERSRVEFRSEAEVAHLLKQHGAVAWHMLDMPQGVGRQLEECHPGAIGYAAKDLSPSDMHVLRAATRWPYCCYWAATWDLFAGYVAWVWPMHERMASERNHPYLRSFSRAWAHYHERLFGLWCVKQGVAVFDCGK